ncbi:peptidylprolyl isomerase [Planctomicrobium sp. SH664]|uniref:peptidylprolyl isomerase n=1 Tax=Planctomicrobium sp. SH664 TaxID=3448125 RepID=UPI003F5BBA41
MKPLSLLALSLLLLTGCVAEAPDPAPPVPAPKATAEDHDHDHDHNHDDEAEAAAGEPYQVEFDTSKGKFVMEVVPKWAPRGAARFKELLDEHFFDDARFFRLVPGFVVQFGLPADAKVATKWQRRRIEDDRVKVPNTPGTVTFATSGPHSRTTQLFINLADNSGQLDGQGFSPFGKVISGMDVIDALNKEYGEQPQQDRIQKEGNAYLNKSFPRLDFIKSARILPQAIPSEKPAATEAEPAKTEEAAPAKPAAELPKPVHSEPAKPEPVKPADEPKSEASKPADTPPQEPAAESSKPADEKPAEGSADK